MSSEVIDSAMLYFPFTSRIASSKLFRFVFIF